METNLLIESLKFMSLGMTAVFIFLVVMIFCMNIMSFVIHKFFPDKNLNVQVDQTDKKKIVAAISAAIMHHRQG